jgi:hypothetical protein
LIPGELATAYAQHPRSAPVTSSVVGHEDNFFASALATSRGGFAIVWEHDDSPAWRLVHRLLQRPAHVLTVHSWAGQALLTRGGSTIELLHITDSYVVAGIDGTVIVYRLNSGTVVRSGLPDTQRKRLWDSDLVVRDACHHNSSWVTPGSSIKAGGVTLTPEMVTYTQRSSGSHYYHGHKITDSSTQDFSYGVVRVTPASASDELEPGLPGQ